jgi:hypothetical protein
MTKKVYLFFISFIIIANSWKFPINACLPIDLMDFEMGLEEGEECDLYDLAEKPHSSEKSHSSAPVPGTNHSNVSFAGESIDTANFSRCICQYTDFSHASLKQSNFCGTDLTNANFCGSDLTNANFCDANLTGANFYNANLTGANLKSAKGLNKIQIQYLKQNNTIKLPDDEDYEDDEDETLSEDQLIARKNAYNDAIAKRDNVKLAEDTLIWTYLLKLIQQKQI